MSELGVNIDHVATIREARKIDYPNPVEAALLCQRFGADSIVCHLREDRRHIQDKDLRELKKAIKVKLNLEMAMSEEIVNIALLVKPDQITLVPEKRRELTTEGGLDVLARAKRITSVLKKMKKHNIKVSLFIDPDEKQIKAAMKSGVEMIELHTGCYANARNKKEKKREFDLLRTSALFAKRIGLKVFAGHGLHYKNIAPLRKIKEIEEYNIGHSIIARAVFVGLGAAVKEMKALVT
ncbi:MAG: pyridoxine 5'-phosphate synthase [Candidatus Omnitrophica bacterium]|nr:pyridoxine 5'-phosphate synthase [Candidatus Omnitrophota bacterium]